MNSLEQNPQIILSPNNLDDGDDWKKVDSKFGLNVWPKILILNVFFCIHQQHENFYVEVAMR